MKQLNRRQLLLSSALGFGSLSLRSLITGLPAPFLMGLNTGAIAQEVDLKYLIMSHLSSGDPSNTNVPGTYPNDPGNSNDPLHNVDHATTNELGDIAEGFENPGTFSLGNQQVKAAQPWAELPGDLRSRMGFWHHSTDTNAHPDFTSVTRLNGAVKGMEGTGVEELDTFIADEVSANLGTLSHEPMSVGGSRINIRGRTVPLLRPLDIKNLFVSNIANIDKMLVLRDRFIDKSYRTVKTQGTPAQRIFLDKYAQSRQEAAVMGDSLGELITDITANNVEGQVKMAIALLRLNIAPVVTLGLGFGGDNHADSILQREVDQTIESVAAIETLWSGLKAANMEDRVVFASLNTFGRTLKRSMDRGGRNHNGNHHVMFTFGEKVKPGVVGGIEPKLNRDGSIKDFKAKGINSVTGFSEGTRDIAPSQTFSAVGKTLAKAVGIAEDKINLRIDGGKIITGALS